MLKLEIEEATPGDLCRELFGTDQPAPGQSVELGGLTLTNMTAGADNLDAQTVLIFVVENKEAIAASIAANTLYDALKGGASMIRAAGRKILSAKDVEDALDDST